MQQTLWNMSSLETEGIKYIGSKKKLLGYIFNVISALDVSSVLDVFSGTTRVGQMLKQAGYLVGTNDLAHYSKVFGDCYISNNVDRVELDKILSKLNNVEPTEGFITKHYAGGARSKSGINEIMYWQRKNTMKADAIRDEIDRLFMNKIISKIEKSILLTSLILALDKVDNALGQYQTFLKNKWSTRSYKDLVLIKPRLIIANRGHVFQQDANILVKDISSNYEISYLDSPYTSHNYSTYYHVWDTLVLNDKPEVVGVPNRRKKCFNSSYNKKREAESAYEDLLANIKSKYIIASYSNEGIIPVGNLENLFKKFGDVSIKYIDYKRNVMSQTGIYDKEGKKVGVPGETRNFELLILLKKK